MAQSITLETPDDPGQLYLACTPDDVELFKNRPLFTGDVFQINDALYALIQHPCSMRRGSVLAPKLLMSRVRKSNQIPKDWSTGHFKRMFLPDMDGENYTLSFEELEIFESTVVEWAARITILSEAGTNLLIQRWVYHNSRVVVPTITLHGQTTGPFNEAELVGEAVDELTDCGISNTDAIVMVDDWLGGERVPGGISWRESLVDPQLRATVRRSLRRYVGEEVTGHQ